MRICLRGFVRGTSSCLLTSRLGELGVRRKRIEELLAQRRKGGREIFNNEF